MIEENNLESQITQSADTAYELYCILPCDETKHYLLMRNFAAKEKIEELERLLKKKS